MKKIILGLALLIALGTTSVNAQRVRYYYYPSTNVYYNPVTNEYWYYDDPTTAWLTVRTLPTTVVVNKNTRRYVVYHNNKDPWRENAMDKKKYKGRKH